MTQISELEIVDLSALVDWESDLDCVGFNSNDCPHPPKYLIYWQPCQCNKLPFCEVCKDKQIAYWKKEKTTAELNGEPPTCRNCHVPVFDLEYRPI